MKTAYTPFNLFVDNSSKELNIFRTALDRAFRNVYIDLVNQDKQGLSFENVEDLRNFTQIGHLDSGTCVSVAGFYTVGDGGGGMFCWDISSVETPVSGMVIASSVTTVGRWKRVKNGFLNVKWFGAKGDGATSDDAAFEAAYSYATSGETIFVPKGIYAGVAVTGTKYVVWFCDGAVDVSSNPLNLPGLLNGTFQNRLLSYQRGSQTTDYALWHSIRNANHTGGGAGNVQFNVRVATTAGANITNHEWSIIGIVDNYATNAGTEQVGVYAQGNKRSTSGSKTWALCTEARDYTYSANPTGALLGAEIGIFANGTDNNNLRVGVDVSIGKSDPTGAQNVVAAGVRVGPTFGTHTEGYCKKGFHLLCDSDIGLDLSDSVIAESAIRLADEQKIDFTATATHYLRHTSGKLQYRSASLGELFSVEDTGILNLYSNVTILGDRVLTSRRTGWESPTGTKTTTLFDTATVTLPQLAERVKGLIDDLIIHGLIGT